MTTQDKRAAYFAHLRAYRALAFEELAERRALAAQAGDWAEWARQFWHQATVARLTSSLQIRTRLRQYGLKVEIGRQMEALAKGLPAFRMRGEE